MDKIDCNREVNKSIALKYYNISMTVQKTACLSPYERSLPVDSLTLLINMHLLREFSPSRSRSGYNVLWVLPSNGQLPLVGCI